MENSFETSSNRMEYSSIYYSKLEWETSNNSGLPASLNHYLNPFKECSSQTFLGILVIWI